MESFVEKSRALLVVGACRIATSDRLLDAVYGRRHSSRSQIPPLGVLAPIVLLYQRQLAVSGNLLVAYLDHKLYLLDATKVNESSPDDREISDHSDVEN